MTRPSNNVPTAGPLKSFLGRLLPPLPLVFPCLVSGVLLTLCFPVASLGPVSFLALTPMFAAMLRYRPSRREAYRAGFLTGFACYVSMLWWIVKLIPSADVTVPWLMTPALIALVLYLSLYPAFHMLIVAAVSRWRLIPFLIAVPAAWALLEVARSRGELAFPWGLVGYSLSDHTAFLQTADVWGVFGLSFLVVLVNVLAAGCVGARTPRAKAWCGLSAGLVAGAMWLHGDQRIDQVRSLHGPTLRVALAQPNIDLAVKWKPEFKDSTFSIIQRQAVEAAELGTDIIIFPETAAPIYIENSPARKQRLIELARALETPVFIGFLDHRFDGPANGLNIYNSSGLFRADGSIEKYDKRHLLPFGEALPLGSRYRWIQKINFGQANFQPGPRRSPLSQDGLSFTPLICFESVFPDLCREGVEEGSELFVNITNDGWFGDTPGPHQHAQMAILRAVEFRRWLVRSANSGVSMVVEPTGDVVASIGLYKEGILAHDVSLLSGRTFYARTGDAPLIVGCALLLVVAWLFGRRAMA
ncbi:MAG TPA: apolipoprotein N-acyltransferase [Candidatus Krumholzibacteria bacterium]|nr:apolipoprotein N-acyltransferase [Candidatus Krumholzibacteria bacterium]